jgi:hypothetical protein
MMRHHPCTLLLIVALVGCRASAPVCTPAAAPPVAVSKDVPPNTSEEADLPADCPMPTMSTVGMWMQLEEGTGWGGGVLSIFADGRIVRLTWKRHRPHATRKSVSRSVLEKVRSATENAGFWDLDLNCCNCQNDISRRTDDGHYVIVRFFEPGKVREVEYREACPDGGLRALADRIHELIGSDGWVGSQ